jgi:oligoribonuclease (3'-5' exoribonuclease)
MPKGSLILMLDLETTGNESVVLYPAPGVVKQNPDASEIVEVGLIMLDNPSLQEIGSFEVVIQPSAKGMKALMSKDVVRKMHETNGLLAELQAGNGVHPAVADAMISKWLDQFTEDSTHIPYGGSGVTHFDRQYINLYLPRLARRITYWALDVGAPRRIFEIKGGDTYSIDAKDHRSLQDTRVHSDELRFYAEAGDLASRYRDLATS